MQGRHRGALATRAWEDSTAWSDVGASDVVGCRYIFAHFGLLQGFWVPGSDTAYAALG